MSLKTFQVIFSNISIEFDYFGGKISSIDDFTTQNNQIEIYLKNYLEEF